NEAAANEERDLKAKALETETKARQQAFAALRSMTADVVERKFAQGAVLTDDDKAFLRGVIAQFDAFAAIQGDDADSRAARGEGRGGGCAVGHPPREPKGGGGVLGPAPGPKKPRGRHLPPPPRVPPMAGHWPQQPRNSAVYHGPVQGGGSGLRRGPGHPQA